MESNALHYICVTFALLFKYNNNNNNMFYFYSAFQEPKVTLQSKITKINCKIKYKQGLIVCF